MELLTAIFGYLTIDDCFSAARTCHAWRQILASSNCPVVVPTTGDENYIRAVARKIPLFGCAALVFHGISLGHEYGEDEDGYNRDDDDDPMSGNCFAITCGISATSCSASD